MKLFKIGIILVVFLLALSIASAVELTDFKAPANFNKADGDYFKNGNYELTIVQYSDSDKEFYFINDTDYIVQIGESGANYTDNMAKHIGALELVDIDGEKYLVECFSYNVGDTDLKECNNFIYEFNKLNNLEPLTIE